MSPRTVRTPSSPPRELAAVPVVRPGPLVPQKTYSAPNTAGFQPKEIEFRLEARPLGVPMRLLQDPGAMDLPIEGANTVPFSQSVASTITLRIWVGALFNSVMLSVQSRLVHMGHYTPSIFDQLY